MSTTRGVVPLRETSSQTTRLALGYVREARGEQAVGRVLQAAQVPETLEQLQDPNQWVSYSTRIRLFEAIAQEFGDERVLFDIGGALVRQSVNPSTLLLMRALGTPAQVYRTVPRAVARFGTTSTMRVLDIGPASATLDLRLHPGYAHSALDCLYARGLLSTIPTLFGLPQAEVAHPECQQSGAPACVYRLSWARSTPWSRWRARRRSDDAEVRALRGQLEGLQSAAAELTGSDDVRTVLRRITSRAAAALLAQGYLLSVTPAGSDEPVVEALGVPAAEAHRLAERLRAGADLGPSAVVVDIVSARRHHGRLAALYPAGQTGLPDERRLLSAYAGHAAAALDLLTALEHSRRDEERARTLLGLSHELSRAAGTEQVCDLVAKSLLRVVGCESGAVLLWHGEDGELRTAASTGLSPTGRAALDRAALRPQDTPELVEMLTTRAPLALRAGTAQPALRALLDAVGVEHLVAVPLVAGDDLLGVVSASWGPGPAPLVRVSDLTLRLQGVADLAATALRNTQLLSTVRHQALHDALTGLPNRVLFADRLEQAVTNGGAAVLFCDLDRFKQVNDQFGHAAGDELLRQVAARLQRAVRPGDSVGRLSGDEFAVLLPGADRAEAEGVADRLVACFEHPFKLEGRELRVTTSIGVADGGTDDGAADRLLRAADAAMYAAKQRGRNQVHVAGRTCATPSGGPSLAQELRQAVAGDELSLVFQPVLALPSREQVAVEALVRWEHPRLGSLPPSAFLPVAEEVGLVADVDLWVLRSACHALAGWSDGAPRRVAANLSSAALADARLLPAVRQALADSGLSADRLEIEVVESRSLVDLPHVTERLLALRRLGVHIALDDFGTGFSTLSLLQHLPATSVKVDRSFVSALGHDDGARALVRGVLALGAALGLQVVAEGVETREQLDVLEQEGCRLVQGYLLGRPSPAPRRAAPGARPAA